jgi:hypothetical protein
MANEDMTPGTKVSFKLQGQEGIFYGVVTRIHNGNPLIQPEKALSPRAQMIDIQKVKV